MAGKRGGQQLLREQIEKLSPGETKELLLLTMYKLTMVRSQLDALTDVVVKKKLATREELWKATEERFRDQSL